MTSRTTTTRARYRHLSGLAILLLLICSSVHAGVTITSGHAGHWYVPERDGEGWVLEMLDHDTALLYWFTYDEEGGQRWMTAVGDVVRDAEGEHIDFPQLVVTSGARFGNAFDPDDVVREAVGSAHLRFDDCDQGAFGYSAFGQSQSFAVSRLARVMGSRCETPHGVTGREVAAHAGQSGSWYDPAHDGEGYTLHWATPDQAIIIWYSYDDEGNQYWMLGVGRFDAQGRIQVVDLHATRGARFGAGFDPDDVERFEWGALHFDLDCQGGSATYASVLPAFGDGALELSRLTGLYEVGCPWQPPKLTDLYELALTALPIAIDDHADQFVRGFSADIADDGTIWTHQSISDAGRVLRLTPGAGTWQVVGDLDAFLFRTPVLSRGDRVLATERLDASATRPVQWSGAQWHALDPELGEFSRILGASALGAQIVGLTFENGDGLPQVWRWDAESGQTVLPMESDPPFAGSPWPSFASEDGSTVVGQLSGLPPSTRAHRFHAMIWRNDDAPSRLIDADGWTLAAPGACGDDCRIVFGSVASRETSDPTQPDIRQEPWYWLSDGRSAFLGRLEHMNSNHTYGVVGAATDGNLVAGAYGSFPSFSAGAGASVEDNFVPSGIDSFIWTAHTGMVAIGDALTEAGLAPAWPDLGLSAISADGRRIMLTDGQSISGNPQQPRRIALLELTPRQAQASSIGAGALR